MTCGFEGHTPEIAGDAFVAPDAVVAGRVKIGGKASVWFGAVIRGDGDEIAVGDGTNIQDRVVIHADPGFPCRIGREVTVGHGAILHGCTVGDGALIGMGAILMNGSVVGEGAIVGAGSLLPEGRTVPPGALALGQPASVRRDLTPAERSAGRLGAAHYAELAGRYRQGI